MQQPQKIVADEKGALVVPDVPVIPYIEGDGIGPDIWHATRTVIDAVVATVFDGRRLIEWKEVLIGEKGHAQTGSYISDAALAELADHVVSIKGPLTTPVGQGMRSLNVTIRQKLDLFACVRPVRYIHPVPSPMKRPEKIDMVVFRENTEDLYAGIEWASGSDGAHTLIDLMKEKLGVSIDRESGVGIKPISAANTKRLVDSAIAYALEKGLPSVTLMHKGNIMKYTEGAFARWGYEVAAERYADRTITEAAVYEDHDGVAPEGRVVIKDRIADMLFQQVLLRPDEYHVIATPNLNGDYISDALAAQVGGLGMAPGANIGKGCAVFEATHGSAPKYTGQDKVNPSSLILSGAMMLEHLGWVEAAEAVADALCRTVADGTVTYDLARQIEGATEVKCSQFAERIVANIRT